MMRTTVTINDALYAALKHRAFDSGMTISSLMELAVKHQVLEDLEDIDDATNRLQEQSQDFHSLLSDLKSKGLAP